MIDSHLVCPAMWNLTSYAYDSLRTCMIRLITSQGRPPRFASLAKGVEWCYRSKTVRNLASARVSMPPQLKPDPLAFASASAPAVASSSSSSLSSSSALSEAIANSAAVADASFEGPFTWRTDLFATAPHWRGWFTGLSDQVRCQRCRGKNDHRSLRNALIVTRVHPRRLSETIRKMLTMFQEQFENYICLFLLILLFSLI
jgi:hypothetical protein